MISIKVKNVISSIDLIGEVGFDSEEIILQAERLFNALPFKKREGVINHQKLINARAQFEKLKLLTVEKNEMGYTIIAAKKRFSGKLIIPSCITAIGVEAFESCKRITSIIIPSSVRTIGSRAFIGCSRLAEIRVSKENEKYKSIDNCLIEIESNTLILGCKNSIVPDDGSVSKIGNYAFYACIGLKNLSIPSGITEIGCYAFMKCVELTTIVIPSGVNAIEHSAFWGCSKLSSIKLPNGLTSLKWRVFLECTALTSVEIPHSVKTIEEFAFGDCSLLTSIKMSAGLMNIENYAFSGCQRLKRIIIPYRVKRIGKYAFFECSDLEKVIFQSKKSWWIKLDRPIISGIVMNTLNESENAKNLRSTYVDFSWCLLEEKNNIFYN